MGRYLGIPLLLIAAILQSTVTPEIRIGEAGPDLILMLVVTWTLLAGFEESVLWALAGGIFADLLTRMPTGTTAFALVFVSFVISNVPGQISRNNVSILKLTSDDDWATATVAATVPRHPATTAAFCGEMVHVIYPKTNDIMRVQFPE